MKVALISIEVLIALVVIWGICTYNRLIKSKNKTDSSAAAIKACLMKRYSLITRLIDLTKGYSRHEKETLVDVINARKMFNGGTPNTFISALEEKYPELKANENFTNLSQQLVAIESELFRTREEHNKLALSFNNSIMTFPVSLFARLCGFHAVEYVEDNGADLSDSAFDKF